jgi:RimJ/RimL family protein N-acetyltransferase
MIRYQYDDMDELLDWAEQRNPARKFRSDARAIGLISNGKIRAVTVYDNWSGNDCLVHLCSDGRANWFTREYAVRTMAYPFIQCELKRISCLISENNTASLNFTLKFGGWTYEGAQREAGYEGEDLYLFGMLRRECVWLSKREPMPELAMAV